MTRDAAMRLEFRSYQRPFARVLSTSHGNWEVREGIILRLTDENGRIGWGEIAPIPWFGSETLEQAKEFCQQLPPEITATDIFSIPDELPACQFGFECAWGIGNRESGIGNRQDDKGDFSFLSSYSLLPTSHSPVIYSYLLPTGKKALESWQAPWNQGYRTFKWKIGVASIEAELNVFDQLIQALPSSTQLRLDANGGLTQQEAIQWLQVSDKVGIVEFLEQPLPPEHFKTMLEMSSYYSTPIALDESVATLNQLEACYQQGWRGIFVIKPSIAGSPKRLRQFCKAHDIDTVFSSVFESAIARHSALQLATELSHRNRAVGFGINHWFNDNDETWLEQLWKGH
jgi:O-succinylbenzoate synthase